MCHEKYKHHHQHHTRCEKTVKYSDIKFRPSFPSGQVGTLELPNGFVLRIQYGKGSLLDFITVRDGLNDYMKEVSETELIPELSSLRLGLRQKAEIMYVCDVIDAIQKLTPEDFKKFKGE